MKYLIVGLGNPGKKYIDTRHNIGFDIIDVIAAYFGAKVTKLKCKALVGECKINDFNIILAKPQTYMNLSGESVSALAAYYKIQPENIIVIYDDISLNTGKVRIRPKGSAGGHNGMKNIIYFLNTDEFPRIRIGIGEPDCELIDYVLQKFSKQEIAVLTELAKIMPDLIITLLENGIPTAMNKFN